MTPAQWLAQSKFIRWAFLDNTWVLAHAFLGICLANGFYLAGYLLGIKALSFRPVVLVCTFVAAIVWDYVIEPVLELARYGSEWREIIYGSTERQILDSIGDVLAAVVFAAMSIYSLPSLF